MLISFFVVIVILSIFRPKSKLVFHFGILFLLFMFSFVFYKGDYETYSQIYDGVKRGLYFFEFEPAFSFLFVLSSLAGIPYAWFRFLIGLIMVSLLARFIKDETEFIAITLVLLMIFPFFVFVATIRSGVAWPIVLFAIRKLSENGKDSKKVFCCLIAIASLFHYSCIFFFFLLLVPRLSLKKRMVLFICMVLFSMVLNFTNVIPRILQLFTSRVKTLQWFTSNEGTSNLAGAIVQTIVVVSMACISRYYAKICTSGNGRLVLSRNQIELSSIAYRVSSVLIFALPLMWFSSPFMRLFYTSFPLVIISGVNASQVIREKGDLLDTIFHNGFLFVICVLLRVYDNLPYLKQGSVFFGEFFNPILIFK